MRVWYIKKVCIPLWVSKEVSGPQYCRNKVKKPADNDFSVEKLKLLSKIFSLYIWKDFLCKMEVMGAIWIMRLRGVLFSLA